MEGHKIGKKQIEKKCVCFTSELCGETVEEWYWNKCQSTCMSFICETISSYSRNFCILQSTKPSTIIYSQPKLKEMFEIFQIICRKFEEIYIPERDINSG